MLYNGYFKFRRNRPRFTGDGDDSDRRRPLLAPTEEIHPYTDPMYPQHPPLDAAAAQPEEQRKPERVVSLDVFRGFTVAVSGNFIQTMLVLCSAAPKFRRGLWLRAQMMILVDDAGGAWPGINHAPWIGVTVADFVMPAFLFIIGVSAALVFKVVC